MWLSVLLEFVRQTKLLKTQSKLSPDTSLLESFSLPFFSLFASFENVDTNTECLILVSLSSPSSPWSGPLWLMPEIWF